MLQMCTLCPLFSLTMRDKMPRGLRNNNPFNIKFSPANDWQGSVKDSAKQDYTFEEFIHPKYGVRAALKLLDRYYFMFGCRTIRNIINRWAPPVENSTLSYIEAVCRYTGKTADDEVNPRVYRQVMPLLYAMFKVENGIFVENLPDRLYWQTAFDDGFNLLYPIK